MELNDFRTFIRKEYAVNKYGNYFFSFFFLFLGCFFFYTLFFNNWVKLLSPHLFVLTFLFDISCFYFCLKGFINIPKLTKIHKISDENDNIKIEKILSLVAKKHNLTKIENDKNTPIKLYKKHHWLFKTKNIYYFIDKSGVYINIQTDYKATFMDYKSCMKLQEKLKNSFKELSFNKK